MPMSAFGRVKSWFGDDEEDGPTPLFPATAEKQSLFPVQSDSSPVLSGLKAGWKGLGDWLNGPATSEAGTEGDLLGYKPTNRWGAISDALGGAAKGVLNARGQYSNWLGQGLLGAGEGLEASRKHDLELRKLAQEQQYKQAEVALKSLQARNEAVKAGQPTLTAADGSVFQTDPYTHETKLAATAPARPMSADEKARLQQGDQRLEQERKQAEALAAYRQSELAQGQARLGLSREELKQKQAAGGDAAEALKTQAEREDARLRRYSEMQAKGQPLTDEQALDFKDLWKQRSAPKYQLDATGNMQEVRPDVTHLTPPPGETAPTPGMTITPTLPGREQMGKAQESYASTQTANAAIGRIEGLLKDATPGQLYGGDTAAKLNTEALAMQGALGELQHAGVLNEGEVARYNSALGSLTGAGAAAGAAVGYQPVKATLAELRTMLDAKLKNTLPRALSEEDASRMPKGVPFLMPSGAIGRN